MAGKSKGVWWWKARKQWVATINGKRHCLGPEKADAETQYHELMANRGKPVRTSSLTIGVMLDKVLTFTQKNRSARTHAWYQMFFQGFLSWLVKTYTKPVVERMAAMDVTGDDVQSWIDSEEWGPTTRHGAVTAIKRGFNYSEKMGLIDKSPVRGVEKPQPTTRETVISAEKFKEILGHVKDENFRDVLMAVWLTGCRPQEVVRVEATFIMDNCWLFPIADSKGKKRPRVVFLTDEAKELSQKWAKKNPKGPIFRNVRGRPWTAMSFNCRFIRLKDKVGSKVCMYQIRHSYAHQGLTEGEVSPEVMATLLGHADTSMVYKTYGHLLKNQEFMKKSAAQVRPTSEPPG